MYSLRNTCVNVAPPQKFYFCFNRDLSHFYVFTTNKNTCENVPYVFKMFEKYISDTISKITLNSQT